MADHTALFSTKRGSISFFLLSYALHISTHKCFMKKYQKYKIWIIFLYKAMIPKHFIKCFPGNRACRDSYPNILLKAMTDPKNEDERMPFKLDIIHKMLRIKQAFFFLEQTYIRATISY